MTASIRFIPILAGACLHGIAFSAEEVSDAEIRVNRLAEARPLAEMGTLSLHHHDFAGSAAEFKTALAWVSPLSNKDSEVEELRRLWRGQFVEAVVALAFERFEEAKYSEAIELAAEVLRPSLDRDNQAVQQLLNEKLDPCLLLDVNQRQRIEWVRSVVSMQWETDAPYLARLHGGLFDASGGRFGMLWSGPDLKAEVATKALREKLETLIIPSISVVDAPLLEVLAYLEEQAGIVDTSGVKFVSNIWDPDPARVDLGFDPVPIAPPMRLVSMELKNASLQKALDEVCDQLQVTHRIEPSGDAVAIYRDLPSSIPMFEATFRVPPSFVQRFVDRYRATAYRPAKNPFVDIGGKPNVPRIVEIDLREFLKQSGASITSGSKFKFDPRKNLLHARNSQTNLDLLEAYLDSFKIDDGFDGDPALFATNEPEQFGIIRPPRTRPAKTPEDERALAEQAWKHGASQDDGVRLYLEKFFVPPWQGASRSRDPFSELDKEPEPERLEIADPFERSNWVVNSSAYYDQGSHSLDVRSTAAHLAWIEIWLRTLIDEAGREYRSSILGSLVEDY